MNTMPVIILDIRSESLDDFSKLSSDIWLLTPRDESDNYLAE